MGQSGNESPPRMYEGFRGGSYLSQGGSFRPQNMIAMGDSYISQGGSKFNANSGGYTPASQVYFKDGNAYTRTGNISREGLDYYQNNNQKVGQFNPVRQMNKAGIEPQPYKYEPFNFEVPKYEGYGVGKYGPAKKYGGSK